MNNYQIYLHNRYYRNNCKLERVIILEVLRSEIHYLDCLNLGELELLNSRGRGGRDTMNN